MAKWHGTTCSCGRVMKKMHCSACGSTNLQGLAKQARHVVQDETGLVFEQLFKSYRCRACAEVSDEWITLNHCSAPKLEVVAARTPGTTGLTGQLRKEKIEEALRLFGKANPETKPKVATEWKDEFFTEDIK